MSWHDSLQYGLLLTGPSTALRIFQMAFGFTCLVKFITETRRGYFHIYDESTYLHFCAQKATLRWLPSSFIYRTTYILKLIAAICLSLEVYPKIALILILSSFVIELRIFFKFHTSLFFLFSFLLLASPASNGSVSLTQFWPIINSLIKGGNRQENLISQQLIVVTMCVLYICSGLRKLNHEFLSGNVLSEMVQFTIRERSRRKYHDGYYPKWFLTIISGSSTGARMLRCILCTSCALVEIILPCLLLYRPLQGVGVVLGISMHLAFCFLYPATLLHFSLGCICTYILFIKPDAVFEWLNAFTRR